MRFNLQKIKGLLSTYYIQTISSHGEFPYNVIDLSHASVVGLWANSADDILNYFSYFSQKTGFGISCKLSPLETVCMKCLILF